MLRILDIGSSLATTVIRLGSGVSTGGLGPRPDEPLHLYEFEACPFCRKVREALTALDLPAVVYPCPESGPRYRKEVQERGGRAQFPYLVDPNTGKAMYESDEIVAYLYAQYGDGSAPGLLARGPIADFSSALAGVPRPGFGARYRAAKPAAELLELYSFEGSPFCRIVREKLCELEIAYRLHNVGKGSPGRAAFVERSGKMMVPYLVDPNTGVEMFESSDIVAYLEATYAL